MQDLVLAKPCTAKYVDVFDGVAELGKPDRSEVESWGDYDHLVVSHGVDCVSGEVDDDTLASSGAQLQKGYLLVNNDFLHDCTGQYLLEIVSSDCSGPLVLLPDRVVLRFVKAGRHRLLGPLDVHFIPVLEFSSDAETGFFALESNVCVFVVPEEHLEIMHASALVNLRLELSLELLVLAKEFCDIVDEPLEFGPFDVLVLASDLLQNFLGLGATAPAIELEDLVVVTVNLCEFLEG